MKRVQIILVMAATLLLASCRKEVEAPDFGVTYIVTKTTASNEEGTEEYEAYEVEFKFSGNAENIVFYCGEPGSEYRFRDRYYQDATPKMQFTTNYTGGNIPNTLRIMVSNDFEPVREYLGSSVNATLYTREAVEAATWFDITDRFDLPGNRLLTGARASGEAVVSEFYHDLPLFVGFRFEADKTSDASLTLGQWVFSNFQIRKYFEDGTSADYINNVMNNYWRKVELADSTGYRLSSNTITLNGNITNSKGKPTAKAKVMAISPPFYPSLNASDKGLVIKSLEENVSEYTYLYVAPQTPVVQAVFIATNSRYGDVIRVVKELEIVFD